MNRCVVCRKEFEASSAEHVIPNAFGWTHSSYDHVCPDCNQATSSHDARLVKSFETLINLLNPAGRRAPPPPVSAGSASFPQISLNPGGNPHIPHVMRVEIPGQSPQIVVSDDKVEEVRAKVESRGKKFEPTGRVDGLVVDDMVLHVFDDGESARELLPTLAKITLHAAAWLVPDWDGEGVEADILREIVAGKYEASTWVPGMVWDFDQDDLLFADRFYSGVEVTSCPRTRSLTARVHVLGMIRVRALVSATFRGSDHCVRTVIQEAKTGKTTRDERDCGHPLPWLYGRSRRPGFPIEEMNNYFAAHRGEVAPKQLYERGEPRVNIIRKPSSGP